MIASEPDGFLVGSAARPVVVVGRDLAATTDEVWDAWTRPERLVRWLGAVEAPLTTPGRPIRLAMAADELPDDVSTADNPATFTVLEARPPVDGGAARLVFVFDDAADPGGTVTVELTPLAGRRCRLLLRHSLAPVETAICHAPGFGAGWEGFLDWLDDALAGRDHGPDERYEAVLPAYAAFGERLARVSGGIVEVDADGLPAVRHRRVVAAPKEDVWRALTEPAGLARWLGVVVEGRLGPGERVVIVHDESDPDASRQTSTVRTWQPNERLAMTWGMAGELDSDVEITLAESGMSTVLELVHRGVGRPGDDYLPGWHAHLDLLVAEAEGSGRPSWTEAFRAAQQLT